MKKKSKLQYFTPVSARSWSGRNSIFISEFICLLAVFEEIRYLFNYEKTECGSLGFFKRAEEMKREAARRVKNENVLSITSATVLNHPAVNTATFF